MVLKHGIDVTLVLPNDLNVSLTTHMPATLAGSSITLEHTAIDEGAVEHCQATSLTDAFGLFVQAILVTVAFVSLVVKRAIEPAAVRRPWIIWFYDTSKQGFGASFIHMLNVFLAPWFAKDPCTWYVVSFLLDSTVGLVIIYLGIHVIRFLSWWRQWPTLRFGEYGNPPKCKAWWHQLWAFIGLSLLMKIFVAIILTFPFWIKVRRLILAPIKNPKVEVVVVMLIIPLILNTVMFWVTDNFIKQRNRTSKDYLPDRIPSPSNNNNNDSMQRLLGGSDDGGLEFLEEEKYLKQRHGSNDVAEDIDF